MRLDLRQKRALVCGSTQGIGRACALSLAAAGAEITLVARNETALQDVHAGLSREEGQSHDYVVADFTHPETLRDHVARHLETAGSPYHVLLNNTGGPPAGPALDADPDAFVAGFRMHIVCNQMLVQTVVPGMKEASYGRIINVISTSVREPIPNLGVSNTIRGAVASWAKTLSRELASFGITVNNILPGFTDTARLRALIAGIARRSGQTEAQAEADMIAQIPAGRLGRPEEIANAVTFLASPAAGYINGVSLPVDGGRIRAI